MRLVPLLLSLALLVGCASQRRTGMPLVRAGDVRIVIDEGPWQPVPEEEEIGGPWRVANGGFESPLEPIQRRPLEIAPDPAPSPVQPAFVPSPPAAPKLRIPRRRAREEVRPVGKRARKSHAHLARDHFLDYPTRIVAQKITLYVPPALVGRVQLRGESVEQRAPGRRQALGAARLTLGELTLEAGRVTLRTRTDGRDDLQIMARGDVQFVAEVRGNVLREQGLRSLLITNDQVVPLR